MNYIVISPHFPSNFRFFCISLAKQGIRVLGIDTENYDSLSQDLKSSLAEYYKVSSLENYTDVLKAVAYFTHKYGKIDRIESHNEHWLSLDAQLREDFNVFGYKPIDLKVIQSKYQMKQVFIKNDIPVAQAILVSDLSSAQDFIRHVDYPVVAKPDLGVGAANTYKLNSSIELEEFFTMKPSVPYVLEAYIQGEIHTFDGLVDANGKMIYVNSFIFPVGIMETVNDDLDMIYYNQQVIPNDLYEMGSKIVKAFKLKERFFHIEFFRTKAQDLYALEINVRPPGGYSMDIFNFANDANYYDIYASVVASKKVDVKVGNTHACLYVGQKSHLQDSYQYSKQEILEKYRSNIVFYGEIASIFAKAIGNYAYILKSSSSLKLMEIAKDIMRKKVNIDAR